MRVIQYRALGQINYGRFGNQLFEYIFARQYAEKEGAKLETPPWIGQKLFANIRDPRPRVLLPTLEHEAIPYGRVNVNLVGFYGSEAAKATWTREYAKRIYTIKPEILAANPKLKEPLIVAHLRRGDFLFKSNEFQVITKHAFEHAITKVGYNLDNAVWLTDGKGYKLSDATMFRDFITMIQADVLFCSNLCTFSWWGSVLGNAKTFVGNVRVLSREEVTPRTKYVSPEFVETVFKS